MHIGVGQERYSVPTLRCPEAWRDPREANCISANAPLQVLVHGILSYLDLGEG